jgi:hypothetical protein
VNPRQQVRSIFCFFPYFVLVMSQFCTSNIHFLLFSYICAAGPISIESTDKDATSGFQTHEKKNRYKRAAKSNLTPPKMKKIKVSQDAAT